MSGRNDQQRDAAWLFAGMAAAMALVIAAIAVIVSNDSVGDPVTKTSTAEVSLKDSSIRPNPIVLATGMADITVHNDGTIVHNFSITGVGTTANLDAGKSTTLSVHGLAPGTYQAICTILGHAAAGMTATVTVAGGGSSAVAAAPSTPTASAATGDATIDFDATPPTDWKPFDPALKPADGAVEHKITLHATEKVIAVAPGVTQQLWTFNDQVPGPILRGKVGDLFTITLTNDGTIGHSIDFHASKVAWNDEMRTINPGQSLVYQFKADFAGIFMYHCGTPPALHHIGNGMFGAIIVDPPELAPVDHEYVLIQSELYLGPQGQPGDLTKMQHEAWDAVVFNSYVNQYKHAPIKVQPNERVRIWVLDAGPSENSAFHIVGTVFDTVFREGTYVLKPDQRRGGSQVLDLQPAQGGFVEMSFAEAGLYPIVTHKFANVGKGAFGLVQAGEVAAMPAGGH